MSGEPKTLTLTPEQQAKLNHLVEREMDEAYYTGLYMKAKDARACLREFAVEVLEELGVPVVARDEAAELRAAIKEWAEAKQAVDDADLAWANAIDAGADVHGYKAAWERALNRERDAEAALRRLAGGETEK